MHPLLTKYIFIFCFALQTFILIPTLLDLNLGSDKLRFNEHGPFSQINKTAAF